MKQNQGPMMNPMSSELVMTDGRAEAYSTSYFIMNYFTRNFNYLIHSDLLIMTSRNDLSNKKLNLIKHYLPL